MQPLRASGARNREFRHLRTLARGARMVLAMHGLEPAQRQMRVNLRGGDVGVAQQQLHAAQVGAMLDHVRCATMPQPVRAGVLVGRLHHMPDPLARERHSAQRKKQAGSAAAGSFPASPRWIFSVPAGRS